MVIYRPHHELLEESLQEARTFASIDEMKAHIVNTYMEIYANYGTDVLKAEDIVLNEERPSIDDDRCGWADTRYVCIKRFGKQAFQYPQCIGMWATQFPNNKE